METRAAPQTRYNTELAQVDISKIGEFVFDGPQHSFLGNWHIETTFPNRDASILQAAAARLRESDIPVAFPTETVYGLAADATRSSAVRGIYAAKQRPLDNPLIVHVSSLSQLRSLIGPQDPPASAHKPPDPIPEIYLPVISRFWPGPLTILVPLPQQSPFAPEVTNSLPTVAVRMPSSKLALALIHYAGIPLAAPSANASSKPSPTTAAHVLHDLAGRIELILDGGPCEVGVESTVIDGLTDPPVILRPGGISVDMLRECPGWKDVRTAYLDNAETGAPRAPGMKYKHYSPNAKVFLLHGNLSVRVARRYIGTRKLLGIIRTKNWKENVLLSDRASVEDTSSYESSDGHPHPKARDTTSVEHTETTPKAPIISQSPPSIRTNLIQQYQAKLHDGFEKENVTTVYEIGIGPDIVSIAQGLFSALREMDLKKVDVILVEAIDDAEGATAAAVMNRLRKAAIGAEIVI